jgi:hypothetical protein
MLGVADEGVINGGAYQTLESRQKERERNSSVVGCSFGKLLL